MRVLEKKNPIYTAGILYTVNALIVVLSAWVEGLHRFELGLTISRYVGLRQWTAVMYIVVAAIMTTLALIYLKRSEMITPKKFLYVLAFVCIFGCAVCPHNRTWSEVLSDIHNVFAYSLILIALISFVWMAVKPFNIKQRVYSIVAICYAVFFIITYVVIDWAFIVNTIFIWENAFIYIFIGELLIEYRGSKAQ